MIEMERTKKRRESMKKTTKGFKVLWLQGEDTLRKVDYFGSKKEAEKAILNSHDRGWGRAIIVKL